LMRPPPVVGFVWVGGVTPYDLSVYTIPLPNPPRKGEGAVSSLRPNP
jgi:hypothetical protein